MKTFGNHFTKSFCSNIALSLLVLLSVSIAPSTAGEIREEGKAEYTIELKPKSKNKGSTNVKVNAPAVDKSKIGEGAKSPQTETKEISNAETKSEGKVGAGMEVPGESKAESKTELKSESKSDSNTELKVEPFAGTKVETKIESKPPSKPQPAAESFTVDYDIRPLKGKLDHEPVLNSNSPEIVQEGGILLSTLDPAKKNHGEAHLDFPIKGPFSIFFHHINKQEDREARKLLSVSLLAFNPGASKATLTYNALCSYVSQPDAPVGAKLAPVMDDDAGKIYAGQGDRVASDFVRGKALLEEPFVINVPPHSYTLVTDLPIKVYGAVSTLNGRTYYANCLASKPLQFAILASFSCPPGDSTEVWHPEDARTNMISLNASGATGGDSHSEYLSALIKMIDEDGLAGPREGDKRPPTLPHSKEAIVYSRVSGVQSGARISASHSLPLQPGKTLAVAYPISSVEQGTLGTGEIQTAPLIKRYPNCAYAAHGNYCVHYQVDLKLVNKGKKSRFVDLALPTPIKADKPSKSLSFFKEQDKRVFFRGVVKVTEADVHGKLGKGTVHYYHLVAHRGEKLPPFTRVEIEGTASKLLRIELYYTPDATPPQALTIDSES